MSKDLFSFVGKSLERVDGAVKAEGKALYGDDISFPNMIYAAAVRNPKPRIEIRKMDDSLAKKIKGYFGIVSFKDIKGKNSWPLVMNDYPFLPEKEAKFYGETLALVLAENQRTAKKAAACVRLDYKELPFIDDPLKALEKKSLKIYGKDNIISSFKIIKGDADKAFKDCDVVIEKEFRTNYQVHAYLETQTATAVPEPDGSITVYSSTQCPFYVLDAVAAACGLPNNKVKVIQTVTGGGFGGKEDVPALVAAHAAICALKFNRPVRLAYDRKEDFMSMSKRHPSWARVKYGADKNGKIKACKVKYVLDGGAYATLSPIVLWRGTVHAAGPYKIENVFIETYAAATNKVPCGAYRGFGQPQICFAQESLIDDLAEKLGIDPIDLRLKNMIQSGDKTATGQKIDESCGLKELTEIVRKKSRWDKSEVKINGDKRRALGFSCAYYGVGLGAKGRYLDRAGAFVNIYRDGSVQVNVGNTEMGQGALTVLSQIAAETLNAPMKNIKLAEVDTSKVPDSGPTVASRTTLMSGNAIIEACLPLRENIFSAAAELLKAGKNKITAYGGFFYFGKKKISFEEAVKECWSKRLKMSEQGWYAAPNTTFDINNGQGNAYVIYSYSADIADVEVDIKTGEKTVHKIYAAYDVGRIINPKLAHAQAHGGILQGMGWAIMENLIVKDGIMKNPNFTDYVLPISTDAPQYDISFSEKLYKHGPYKAKGMGEVPLIGVAAAVRNAVKRACGVSLTYCPMIAEKTLKTINDKK
ncbi:MAG: xanthine dehydrogenase family protein molybdopterin-binding subunit [Elusimicrobiota bacterium]